MLTYGDQAEEERGPKMSRGAMGRGRMAVLLLVLLLGLTMPVYGCTSQGPQEQQRPAEEQNPETEDRTETDEL